MGLTLSELDTLCKILGQYNIPYEYGNMYDDNEKIVGHWCEIKPHEIYVEEINADDEMWNSL